MVIVNKIQEIHLILLNKLINKQILQKNQFVKYS